MSDDKVQCRTPSPGKQGVRIARWKYEAVRAGILSALGESPGLRFGDLPREVASRLEPETRDSLGSIGWHVTTVKLELEVQGAFRRGDGAGPQRLFLAR